MLANRTTSSRTPLPHHLRRRDGAHERQHRLAVCTGLGLIAALAPAVGSAAAWTQPKGNLLVYIPAENSVSDERFDGKGHRLDQRRFELLEVSPYIEYGFTDWLTGGLQPKYRRVRVETASGGHEENSGWAETDVFARWRLWHGDQAAFSVQGLVKVPIKPEENSAVPLGRNQQDTQLSFLFGSRHPHDWGAFFYNLDFGYRWRSQDPVDELHFNAFAGWELGSWTLVGDLENTVGVNASSKGTEVLTARPSFRQNKFVLSAGYKFNDHFSAVLGGSTTYAGENIGAGNSVFVGAALHF